MLIVQCPEAGDDPLTEVAIMRVLVSPEYQDLRLKQCALNGIAIQNDLCVLWHIAQGRIDIRVFDVRRARIRGSIGQIQRNGQLDIQICNVQILRSGVRSCRRSDCRCRGKLRHAGLSHLREGLECARDDSGNIGLTGGCGTRWKVTSQGDTDGCDNQDKLPGFIHFFPSTSIQKETDLHIASSFHSLGSHADFVFCSPFRSTLGISGNSTPLYDIRK